MGSIKVIDEIELIPIGNELCSQNDNGDLIILNPMGSLVLKELQQLEDIDSVVRRIANRYNHSISECQKDISVFINELQTAGIIEVSNE